MHFGLNLQQAVILAIAWSTGMIIYLYLLQVSGISKSRYF
jgi:hypothetical protein